MAKLTTRSFGTVVHGHVLSVLGFLPTDTFQRDISDRSGMSHPIMSHIRPSLSDYNFSVLSVLLSACGLHQTAVNFVCVCRWATW